MRLLGRRDHDPERVALLPTLDTYLGAVSGLRSADWTRNIPPDDWGMEGNDYLSDCTIAAIAHAIMTWGSYVPPYTPMTESDVVTAYSGACGYVPGVKLTDRGGIMLDVLKYWHANPVGGLRLAGMVAIDPKNIEHVRLGIEIFGGLYTGVLLTEEQINDPGPWRPSSGSRQGHCIWTNACDDAGFRCITWGEVKPGGWDTWDDTVVECYGLLSDSWARGGKTPEGFAAADMVADAAAIAMAL